MTVLATAPGTTPPVVDVALALRCRTCLREFEFDRGEKAIVVRQVAYAVGRAAWEDISESDEGFFLYLAEVSRGRATYALVHGGACLVAASRWTCPEESDVYSTFGRDWERQRILGAWPAHGRAAATLLGWAMVQHQDGSQRVEGILRRTERLDEPEVIEFADASDNRAPDGESPQLRVLAQGTTRAKRASQTRSR
jgi:hypothetical protein